MRTDKMAKTPRWFGVKTLYRKAPVGRRIGMDELYSRDITLVEERVVVVRARNGDEAIRKAEAEAKKYAADWHRNPYGQRVRTRYLGYVNAYEMYNPPNKNAEVFSVTEVVPKRVSDRLVVNRMIGRPESRRMYESRRNIRDIVFNRPAPGVERTVRERAFVAKIDAFVSRNDA